MRLIEFIEKETTESYQHVAIIAIVSGIANALLLAIINHATEAVANDKDLTQYFILYLLAFALFIYGQWFAFEKAILAIEDAVYNIRIRLTRKVEQVELGFIEKMGNNNLYARLTQSDTLIAQSIPHITWATQVSVLLVSSLLYLAFISPLSFFITLFAISIAVVIFLYHIRFVQKSLKIVKKRQSEYFKSISHLVNGFKEIKLNKQKSDDLLEKIAETSEETKRIKSAVGKHEVKTNGFGRTFIYALLPILVFIVPSYSAEHSEDIFKISTIMLFITGPITILVTVLPVLTRVNIAIDDLFSLEAEMDKAIAQESVGDIDKFSDFKEIDLNKLHFTYPNGDAGFSVGPFDEHISKGELLFIVGGNGSGKSTFLKLLTGLYFPAQGNIYVDDAIINKNDYSAYRNLFSAIFTDFHLFDRFYGVTDVEPETVNYWLEKMQMQHKVSYQDGGFTNTNLSTGQRKRLGLIVAILEEKSILVIDEFAADQDPQFRQYFYETLLGELKKMGKTIIAVTHDDHYFHVADRVLKMVEGKLIDYSELS